MSSVDRKAPCPCGSGRKYKNCCAWKDAAARAAANPPALVEEEFIAKIMPEVDDEVDRLLARLERGERQSVGAILSSLHQRHPGYHVTNYAMGVYRLMAEDNFEGSIPFFEKAVHIFPLFVEAHYNLGGAFMKTGRIGRAVAAYRKAARYSTGNDGIAKRAQDQITGLERIVLKNSGFATLDACIENEQLFDQAFENLSQQRYSEAAEMFGRVLKENPNHVQTHGNLGLCLAGLGRKAAALASLDRALELDPAYGPARINKEAFESMTEGEPFLPGTFLETEYYREQFKSQQGGRERTI
jgi:tetratricopeptide (TPR) repeat protein